MLGVFKEQSLTKGIILILGVTAFFPNQKKWKIFGNRENIKSLLLELEALGDDSIYKS
jgi:hypothetical protein